MYLYLDLETIPAQRPDVRAVIAENIKPPGNIKKVESIDKWIADKKTAAVEEAWKKTALDGTFGEIAVIGWALDDEEIHSIQRQPQDPEGQLLNSFFDTIESQIQRNDGAVTAPIWVAHNGCGFDFRFLWKRLVVNQVKPRLTVPHDVRPWSDKVVDTLHEWNGNNMAGGSMEVICNALGIPGKGDIDGSMVWDVIKAGGLEKVADYCRGDVDRLRQMHKRMML